MARRFAWQGLEQILTKDLAQPDLDRLLREAVVIKDLRDPGLLLCVGKQQLKVVAFDSVNAGFDLVKQ